MDDLFRDHILDHYRHPRCHGTIDKPDARVEDANPLCGDKLRMDFRFADGRVAEVKFSGTGCSISQASASMICEAIEGKTLDEVKALTRQDVLDLLGVDDLGGTMRLGSYTCELKPGSRAAAIYGTSEIRERHRHRYEFNQAYLKTVEDHGLVVSGKTPDGKFVEIAELPDHPWFLAVQYHPEFKSKPLKPHPLFAGFVEASYAHKTAQRHHVTASVVG